MKKILFPLLFVAIFQATDIFSQSKYGNWCGFDSKLHQQLKNLPDGEKELEQFRKNIIHSAQKFDNKKSPTGLIRIIPVVVHVIHDNGTGNISEAQIADGIRVLNEDFARMNADTINTRVVFKPFAGAADFEFRLAKIDPNGNPTTGINRINSILSNNVNMYDDNSLKSLSYWNSSNYFNFWIVNSIGSSGTGGSILGYALLPGWNWDEYGVVMINSQFGRFGTSSSDGRTATHEVGHCLNLFHTFDGGCYGNNCYFSGDDVCDTPPTAYSTWDCSFTQNLCSNDAVAGSPFSNDVEDQIENYMSYDNCQNMFSNGQISRMNAAIYYNPELQNIISDPNLTATGVNSLFAADFFTATNVLCVNQPIKFSDFSYYGQNGWSWSFPGGTPASSSAQNPVITYYSPGLHDVSLTVTDGSNTKTKVVSNYIFVVSPEGNDLPFSEDFETNNIPDGKWFISNPDNDANEFQRISGVGFSGNSCIKMDNIGNSSGNRDELIVGSFDFSNMTNVSIKFKAAYSQKDTSTKDKLLVYVSANCGNSWAPRYAKIGSAIASAPMQINPFIPSDTAQWKTHNVYLVPSLMKENVLIKFVFQSDEGNNFYIDDINIEGSYNPSNSVGENALQFADYKLQVFPNPVSEKSIITLMFDEKTIGSLEVYDLVGRRISTIFNKQTFNKGEHQFLLSSNNLPSGLYFIKLFSAENIIIKKFIVE